MLGSSPSRQSLSPQFTHGLEQELWAGIAIQEENDKTVNIGFAVHDGTYSVDFAIHRITIEEEPGPEGDWIVDHIVPAIANYRKEHVCKILGAGITTELHKKSPNLCSRLWAELDIIPIVVESNVPLLDNKQHHHSFQVDEIADSAARKCLA